MAGSVNKVILIGNLGRDPEVRNFPNGGKVCNLRIATSENWKDRNTGERREGMYGSIFWWVVKLGMALALALSGILLNMTGFDIELAGGQTEQTLFLMRVFDIVIPMVTSAIAIWVIASYDIDEAKANEVRQALEARRAAA